MFEPEITTDKDPRRIAEENTLFRRQRVYQEVFAERPGEAYEQIINGKAPLVDELLRDLAKFCRAYESTYDPDPRRHALYEGRREVWLRITAHLDLPSQKLWEYYTGKPY